MSSRRRSRSRSPAGRDGPSARPRSRSRTPPPFKPQDGGFPLEWFLDRAALDTLELVCVVCHQVLCDAVGLGCSHTFCHSCLERMAGQDPRCATCRQELRVSSPLSTRVRRLVNRQRVTCPLSACATTTTLDRLRHHLEAECPHARVPCPQCSIRLRRAELPLHTRNVCPERTVECPACANAVRWDRLDTHRRTTCDALPVTCPACEAASTRGTLADHQVLTCPALVVVCPGGPACAWQGPRGQLPAHVAAGLDVHLPWFRDRREAAQAAQARVAALEEQLSQLVPVLSDASLRRAIERDWAGTVRALHRAGLACTGADLVREAIEAGAPHVLAVQIELGWDVNGTLDDEGRTTLAWAIHAGVRGNLLRTLVRAGADPDREGRPGAPTARAVAAANLSADEQQALFSS